MGTAIAQTFEKQKTSRTMTLKDWTMREMKKLVKGRTMDFEQTFLKVNGLKEDMLEDAKKWIDDGDKDTLAAAKTETFKLQSILEDHILKDPLPPERIELLKCEIKAEVKDEVQRMSPLLRRIQSNESPDNPT